MGRRVGVRKAAAAKIDEDSPLDVELLKREDEIRAEGSLGAFELLWMSAVDMAGCPSAPCSLGNSAFWLVALWSLRRKVPPDPVARAVKRRCADMKKVIKKAQEELESLLAEQAEAIPEEVRGRPRGYARSWKMRSSVVRSEFESAPSQFLSMPLVEYLARFGNELDDEERIEMEKFAQTSGSSAPEAAKAAAPAAAGVAETPSGEQAGTTVVRNTRTRARTAAKGDADPKTLMPPPPPVTGAPIPQNEPTAHQLPSLPRLSTGCSRACILAQHVGYVA